MRARTLGIDQQRVFFDKLAKKLDIKLPDDWKKLTFRKIIKEGGHFLSSHYRNSISTAIRNVYRCESPNSNLSQVQEKHKLILQGEHYL